MGESRAGHLYAAHGASIYARCRALLRDETAAEDALQETFLKVYKNLDRAPSDAEARLWIFRIATNVCLDRLRARDRDPALLQRFEPLAERSVEQLMADREMATQLLARAPAKLRSAVWLYYVDGFDQEEVAQALGITRRTVGTRLADFLDRARKYLGREVSK